MALYFSSSISVLDAFTMPLDGVVGSSVFDFEFWTVGRSLVGIRGFRTGMS